jgi:hypothetical protein
MENVQYDEIIPKLVGKFPELRSVLQQHLADHGKVFEHVFFGDVAEFIMRKAGQREFDQATKEWLSRFFCFLESACQSDDTRVGELIIVSFVELLNPTNISYKRLVSLAGPNLRNALNSIN